MQLTERKLMICNDVEKPQNILKLSFTKELKTLEDIFPEKISKAAKAEVLNVEECKQLISPVGHRKNWKRVYADCSGLRTLVGFQEGLEELYAGACPHLHYPVGLPVSCQIADFDGSGIHALKKPILITQGFRKSLVYQKMTEGLQVLSLRYCTQLSSLIGIPQSLKILDVTKTAIKDFDGIGPNVTFINASDCSCLKSLKGIPSSCKKLNLDWSAIESLEGLPEGIEEVRVYSCASLKNDAFEKVPPHLLPKIKGLQFYQQEIVDSLYQRWFQKRILLNAFETRQKH